MQQENETLISYSQWPHCTIKTFFDINEVELKWDKIHSLQ